jgi:hypothetical protein
MLPLELIVTNLTKHWQGYGRLRQWSRDCQICGHEYCAEGAIANIFIKHAPEEAAKSECKWDDCAFTWKEGDAVKKEYVFLPIPVMRWIDSWHGEGTAEKLRVSLAYLNDKSSSWGLDQIADLIRIQFGLGDPLAVAKLKGQKVYGELIKKGEGVTTHSK